MSEFVLLYRSTPEAHHEAMGTPERAQKSMEKWRHWMNDMTQKGQLKNIGQPLQRSGSVVRGRAKSVTDGPYIETKEALGGYSVIDADSADEAVDIAKTWPGVDRGWITIEVRPVLEMG